MQVSPDPRYSSMEQSDNKEGSQRYTVVEPYMRPSDVRM